MSFYGFNFQNNPQFSRLFGQNVMQNAQSAYGQGMNQFKPYDARSNAQAYLEQARKTRSTTAQPTAQPIAQQPTSGFFIDSSGRIVDNTNEMSITKYLEQLSGRHGGDMMRYMAPNMELLKTDPTKLGLKQLLTR